MNKLATFTVFAALSGLFLLTTSFGYKTDTVSPKASHSTDLGTLLVGTRWQMADFKLGQDIDLDGDGHLDTNLMSFLRPCDLDNTIVFEPNGTVSVDEGNLNCDGQSASGTPNPGNWSYDKATNSLIITNAINNKTSTWKIIDAADNYLKVKVISSQEGPSSAAIVTWKTR
ncbi:lipocalin family protein [Spirosoma radiotolerans]|uniref:Lipocalin-like domain-containing protein n=1 Tax=Spirosoma radiotolerans TaxID=1379870 RepID=A0A0E4A0F4_9BACT|nr:lipocalin family protein [Spirosoma radiotolerans]AKD57908.1 hypothetical protein SD10_26410 [Spirosoma radiotolerans]